MTLPCDNHQLSLYATHLSRFMCHNSILVYLQAVVFACKLLCYPLPSLSDPCIKTVLEGARHGPPPGTGAVPVTLKIL